MFQEIERSPYENDEAQRARDAARCWNLGRLSYKLDPHQLDFYDHYRAWEPTALDKNADGTYRGASRVYMYDAGRRVGKTYSVGGVIKLEDALQRPNSRHLYASATAVQLKEFVIPVIEQACLDAPEEVNFKYYVGRQGMRASFYCRANNSVLKLVGIDKNPEDLRGTWLDGAVIDEAAHVKGLAVVLARIIYPQFQRRKHARLILASSAPVDPNHDFDKVFLEDCKVRKAYFFQTIEDNTAISEDEKNEFVAAAVAVDPDDARREYYGERVRNRTRVIVPEFDAPTSQKPLSRHVATPERPEFAVAMAAMDPGMRDLFALMWGYWDYQRAKLVIERDWTERNASTGTAAEVIRKVERELYTGAAVLRPGARPMTGKLVRVLVTPVSMDLDQLDATEMRLFRQIGASFVRDESGAHLVVDGQAVIDTPEHEWLTTRGRRDGFVLGAQYETPPSNPTKFGMVRPTGFSYWDVDHGGFRANPRSRVSDTEARLIGDLNQDFGIEVMNTLKDDKEAALNSLRNAFKTDKIEIHARCTKTIEHLTSAAWNKNRTDYERSEAYGHFDLLDALVYLWRMVQPIRAMDPSPPVFYAAAKTDVVHVPAATTGTLGNLRKAFANPGRGSWR